MGRWGVVVGVDARCVIASRTTEPLGGNSRSAIVVGTVALSEIGWREAVNKDRQGPFR
jgi:hypothetical protein